MSWRKIGKEVQLPSLGWVEGGERRGKAVLGWKSRVRLVVRYTSDGLRSGVVGARTYLVLILDVRSHLKADVLSG
jgi:hypothetical protein